jgi:hypothetical protein
MRTYTVLHCNIAPYIGYIQRWPMSESQQAHKPITMMKAEVQKSKKMELFHSVDCALISRRLESVYENSNLFAE